MIKMTVPFENEYRKYCQETGKKEFEKRKTPEFDGGDRRCAGILSDSVFRL